GRQGDGLVRVLVEPVSLPDDTAAPSPGAGREVILTGRVLRGEETVDSFRYRFEGLPTASRGAVPVTFERRLRPGLYKIKVELDSPALGSSFVGERELTVPAVTAPAPAAARPVPDLSPE